VGNIYTELIIANVIICVLGIFATLYVCKAMGDKCDIDFNHPVNVGILFILTIIPLFNIYYIYWTLSEVMKDVD